jgi:transposase InsO family protein
MADRVVSMESKLELIFRGNQAGVNIAALCRELGISRDTYYRSRRRFFAEGVAGLAPRSRRPHHSPALIDADLEDEIVRLRKTLPLDNGAWSIRQELLRTSGQAPAESTIHRALRRRGMVSPQPQKRPKAALRRFEFSRPRDCWQMDISEWRLANGSTAFVIDVEDDCSRKAVAAVAAAHADNVAVWSTVLKGFAENGLPGMFLTDNGRVFTGKYLSNGRGKADFEANLHALRIRTVNARRYHPQTCGKIERFHQTLKRWLRKQPHATTIEELQTQLDTFRDYYNTQRPHRALADHGRHRPACTPQQRWDARAHGGPSPTPLPEQVTVHTPLVLSNGTIGVGTFLIAIGNERTGQRLCALRQGNRVLIFDGSTLIADREIDPSRRYQPSGLSPGRRPRGRKVSDM